jgi:hypothetical protein
MLQNARELAPFLFLSLSLSLASSGLFARPCNTISGKERRANSEISERMGECVEKERSEVSYDSVSSLDFFLSTLKITIQPFAVTNAKSG